VTDYDTLLVLILVPAFILGLQKYIEVRASYSPPTEEEICKIERKSGERSARFANNIHRNRIIILSLTVLLSCTFGLYKTTIVGWIALGGLLICILSLSILVNWRVIYKM
jgi:hypothetical protein